MAIADETIVYYDPYDAGINADPYPTFRRLRDEAPIYYNDRYDLWALSRHATSRRRWSTGSTFSSARERHPRDRPVGHGAAVRASCSSRTRRCTPCTAA